MSFPLHHVSSTIASSDPRSAPEQFYAEWSVQGGTNFAPSRPMKHVSEAFGNEKIDLRCQKLLEISERKNSLLCLVTMEAEVGRMDDDVSMGTGHRDRDYRAFEPLNDDEKESQDFVYALNAFHLCRALNRLL